jgi:hypothetical protein
MSRRGLAILLLGATLAAAVVGVARARADGLPVLGVDVGPVGVVAPSGEERYVTLPAGRGTVVARVEPNGGRILSSALLRGRLTIPAVAYDGSASGLSADGRTLVLIEPRSSFPRAMTTLAVLDPGRLRVRELVRLRGDFSFDAISARGGLLYLIQYVSPRDPTRYLVRAFDLRAGRLLRKPVVDPRELAEDMRGTPLTRLASRDGRWAYTLYAGRKMPFVHALDTSRASARCVDLDLLAGRDVTRARLALSVDGRTLTVHSGAWRMAVVDTRTFRASAPPVVTRAETSGRRAERVWPLLVVVGVAVAGGGAMILRRRRRVLVAE